MSWSSNISNYPNSSIYESRQQKISVDLLKRPIFTKKILQEQSYFSFLCFFLGYQGPFWQPNSPSLLSFCFFHQFDCYDVIDYCRNNCPQFTGCGTYFSSLHLISGLPTLPFWFVPIFLKNAKLLKSVALSAEILEIFCHSDFTCNQLLVILGS